MAPSFLPKMHYLSERQFVFILIDRCNERIDELPQLWKRDGIKKLHSIFAEEFIDPNSRIFPKRLSNQRQRHNSRNAEAHSKRKSKVEFNLPSKLSDKFRPGDAIDALLDHRLSRYNGT